MVYFSDKLICYFNCMKKKIGDLICILMQVLLLILAYAFRSHAKELSGMFYNASTDKTIAIKSVRKTEEQHLHENRNKAILSNIHHSPDKVVSPTKLAIFTEKLAAKRVFNYPLPKSKPHISS